MQLKPGESLRLPDSLRDELSKPVGKIYSENDILEEIKGREIISIGDETSLTMIRLGIKTKLSIFDLKTKRKIISEDILNNFRRRIIVTNPQGYITFDLFKAVKYALDMNVNAIQVIGEEDLASLACISLANNGVIIIYGIPNVGLTTINVDDHIKQLTENILKRMVIENGSGNN